jgi:hypothetical protein
LHYFFSTFRKSDDEEEEDDGVENVDLEDVDDNIQPQFGLGIVPYAFHPLRDDYSDDDDDDQLSIPGDSELANSDEHDDSSTYETADEEPGDTPPDVTLWCKCGKCINMNRIEECICCCSNETIKRIANITNTCVTSTEDFRTICLYPAVLEITMVQCDLYQGLTPQLPRARTRENYRFAAYKNFTFWVYGRLGKCNRVPIPSCAVAKIRNEFESPDGLYVGFKFADE